MYTDEENIEIAELLGVLTDELREALKEDG